MPKVGGPVGYVGSEACRTCHEDQFASWHRSYHRTMTQFASDESVQADFNDVALTTETTRFTLNRKNGEFWVRMEPLIQPSEVSPPPLEVRLGLVTGSHHMQVFWVPEGEGNIQLGFPFTWLIPEKRWVPRNSTFIRPPDVQHGAEGWNIVCSRCHTTAVEPRVNAAARTVDTRVAELGISCEACHGPGERHVAAQKSGSNGIQPGEIVHPKKLIAERSTQVCGFCHSMKWIDKANTWRAHGFEFRPGDDLEQTTPIIRPSRVDAIAGLKDYIARNPDLLNDFFWPDGMVRVSGRELNGVIESPCYKGGKFSCVSCHSLHESEPDDQLAQKGKGNTACTQCHENLRTSSALAAHTHHQVNSPGSECYNCHMPHTTYGILKAIRSHQISSPRVADELASGRPNACNLCHLDKSLTWTVDALHNWYGHQKPPLPGGADSLSHIVHRALSGDAGQRVLAAWHLNWPPALATSGANWIPPVLAQLLDDPYAAVRCVAERSLRGQSDILSTNYDFTIDPAKRTPARESVWEAWQNSTARAPVTHSAAVLLEKGEIKKADYDRLLRGRDEKRLRLRE